MSVTTTQARNLGESQATPTTPAVPAAGDPTLALVGSGIEVPLLDGGRRRYVNLDYAASAPCLVTVKHAVDALLPWYSSVHRGAGFTSQVTTDAFEGAREAVHEFVGAREDDVVVFTRSTTDAINLLASSLPADAEVIAFASEHHANLLPWRRRNLTLLPLPGSPEQALKDLADALADPARGAGTTRLVTVTGASNVTGEIWPYRAMAALAHLHGARFMLDAAQLSAHRRIDVAEAGVDYLALSGHKLYAPFGSGALVGRPDWLSQGEPWLAGGGAVRYVGTDSVYWADLPDRQEAGSPNVVGAVALGVACRTLQAADRSALERAEDALLDHARARLARIPGVQQLRLWDDEHPRIGVLPFSISGLQYAHVAAVLSAEHGIGVRHGCFCAHPLMVGLQSVSPEQEAGIRAALDAGQTVAHPGAVRASIGLGTRAEDIDRLVDAVSELVAVRARGTYRYSPDGADCWPDPDPRPRPTLPFDLASGRGAAR
jgi:selenocysteine lyase/cysteine desulfurase